MVEMDGFGIAVAAFIIITLAVGVFAGKLVKNSGKRLIVAGKKFAFVYGWNYACSSSS